MQDTHRTQIFRLVTLRLEITQFVKGIREILASSHFTIWLKFLIHKKSYGTHLR